MDCVKDNCSRESATYPSMPQWLHSTVCKFHWYVWKYENGKGVLVNDRDDFSYDDVVEEADCFE